MTKDQAVKEFVERLSAIPQEWVQIVAEHFDQYPRLPMWGTMWFIDSHWGEDLMEKARRMAGSYEEIDIDLIEDEQERLEVETSIEDLKKESIAYGGLAVLDQYIDEEMAGEMCILDKDGHTSNLFIYEIEGEYLIGIHGAGFDFYDGVWPTLYDALDLKWHDES
jgi:hypothetical protein